MLRTCPKCQTQNFNSNRICKNCEFAFVTNRTVTINTTVTTPIAQAPGVKPIQPQQSVNKVTNRRFITLPVVLVAGAILFLIYSTNRLNNE